MPVAGAALLAVLAVQIVLDNLRDQFGFANIRIDRDNLVVDTPQVNAVGDDGTLYWLPQAPRRWRLPPPMVNLADAVFTMMTANGGPSYTASAAAARLQTSAQQMTVEDTMQITGSDGMTGTLRWRLLT